MNVGCRILSIENDAAVPRWIRKVGAENPDLQLVVLQAGNLAAGLHCLEDGKVDLVLLDLDLPDSPRRETFARFRAKAPGVRVIVLTDAENAELGNRAVQLGAAEVVVKGEGAEVRMARAIRHLVCVGGVEDGRETAAGFRAESCVDVAEVMILALDHEGSITLVNRKGCQILGYSREELIGKNWFEVAIPPEDREAVRSVFRAIAGGEAESYEAHESSVLTRNGERREIAWHNTVLQDETGRVTCTLSSGEDITERKQTERALRLSEEKFRALAESTIDIIYQLDTSANVRYVGPQVSRYGYAPADVIAHNLCEFVHADDQERVVGEFLDVVTKGTEFASQLRLLDKQGQAVWMEARGCDLRDDSGRIIGVTGILRDTSKRVAAEQALQRSAEHLELAQRTGRIGSFAWSINDHASEWSPNFEELYGLAPGGFGGHFESWVDWVHPDDVQAVERALQRALGDGEFCYDYRIVWPDGSVHWLHSRARVLFDKGGAPIHLVGVAMDISERKRVESDLRASEEWFRRVFDEGPAGMVISGPDFRFVRANAAFCRLVGYGEDELTTMSFKEITHPEHLDADTEQVLRLREGEIPHYRTEKRYVRKDGRTVWGSATLTAMRGEDGGFLYFLAMVEDFTERRAVETALRESEERYRHLVESANDWVWEVDPDGVYTYSSHQVKNLLGYEPEEIIGRRPFDLMPPEEAVRVGKVFGSIVSRREKFRGLINANLHKDGRPVVLETNGAPVFDPAGRFRGYRGMDRDVTDRRNAEESRRLCAALERKLAAVIGLSGDAVIWADRDFSIQGWSAGAERILGHAPGEILGRQLTDLLPPEHRQRLDDLRPHLLRGDPVETVQVDVVRKGGERFPSIVSMAAVEDANDLTLAVVIRELTGPRRELRRSFKDQTIDRIG